jgi:hypothetical protein
MALREPGYRRSCCTAIPLIPRHSCLKSGLEGPVRPVRAPGRATARDLALLPLLISSAFADVSPLSQDAQKQPRTLGQKALLHVYYYARKTLEITYVNSYLFKDESACKNAIPAALQIAMSFAGEDDLVSAKCVAMNPPEAITKPDKKRQSPESTEL